jgi:ubiquinol-cytochrome c reductase cytochrome c1 subunit
MAKDVTTYLAWAAEPEHDERKKLGLKALLVLFAFLGFSVWAKRNKWSYVKTRKLVYNPPKC